MIEVKNLCKTFTKYEKSPGILGTIKGFFNAKKVIKKAVDDISFSIKEGEIVGYIGANGAGKSTTIKILTGILTPSSGSVLVNGICPYKERTKNAFNIGVVFGQRTQLWWDLPLIETFGILKEIYNVSDSDYEKRMKFFDEVLEINDFIKSPVRTLSLGQRMRADIAASLLHNPKVLYLDEPTIGLDVVAKQKMRDAIKFMNKEFNTTVILTTHDLDDIEELCNRIIIIDNGKIMYEGTIDEIKDKYGYIKNVVYEIQTNEKINIDLGSFGLNKEDLNYTIEGKRISINFNKHKINVSDITNYMMKNYKVIDMSVNEQDIEVLVGNIYKYGVKDE